MNKIKNYSLIYIRNKIIELFFKVTHIDKLEISDEMLIREELGIDSLMAMEILAKIEKSYDITINEEEVFKLKTIGEFIEYVWRLINKKQ